MNINENLNNKIIELLKERDAQMQYIEDYELAHFDDENLSKYHKFKSLYNSLTPLEKDLWYLSTQIKRSEIAKLYAVSRSYITILLKKINNKMTQL